MFIHNNLFFERDKRLLMFNNSSLKPPISAFECILLVCSKLALDGKTVLRQDSLVEKLYDCSKKPEFLVLFSDIAFKKSFDSITSADIENSLTELQNFGAIGRLNPAYEKIIIYISEEEADAFLQQKDETIRKAIDQICKMF